MILIDDIILATVIGCVVLLVVVLSSGIACFLGLLISCGGVKSISGGAASKKSSAKKTSSKKESSKKESAKKKSQTKDDLKNIDKLGIRLKEYTDRREIYKPKYSDEYIITPFSKERTEQIKYYLDRAKQLYKKEKADESIFNLGLDSFSEYDLIQKDKNNVKEIMDKLFNIRHLDDIYIETDKTASSGYGIKEIEYFANPAQMSEEELRTNLDKVIDLCIVESVRPLNKNELNELNAFTKDFNSGKLIKPEMKIHFHDKSTQTVANCNANSMNRKYSDTFKKLHWGQRKLLLSEIDFFNRVSQNIGIDKFKDNKISLVYPGAAHGHHLLIEMEMYPNLVLYLWDPAKYIKILYMVDFIRRGLEITFSYTPEEMAEAKKYEGRVYINMELPNDIYLTYHNNATTGNISDNYGPEYGFFTKKSAEYYLKHREKTSDKSISLFCSDIRLFTDVNASEFMVENNIKDLSNLPSVMIAYEQSRHQNYIRDMNLQKDWMKFIKADYGLFKFKLKTKKYSSVTYSQYEYYDGDIILQAWAPISSTETRLFVNPNHKDKAYYNVSKYTNQLNTFNQIMRVNDMSHIKLKDLDIIVDKPNCTIGDIWFMFLPRHKIGMDTILETYILYDYLCIYKDVKKIKSTDIQLMISDITQTCLDPGIVKGILGYLDDNIDAEQILDSRKEYHESFNSRLDYNSARGDNKICNIKRFDKFRK